MCNPQKLSTMKIFKSKKTRKSVINIFLVTLLFTVFSCYQESEIPIADTAVPLVGGDKVSIKPLTDLRIRAEILAMAKAGEEWATAKPGEQNGRTNVLLPPASPLLLHPSYLLGTTTIM